MIDNESLFLSPTEFSIMIEKLAVETRKPLIDTMIKYCEEHYIDFEEITHLISKPLQDKLRMEFVSTGHLKGGATLDI